MLQKISPNKTSEINLEPSEAMNEKMRGLRLNEPKTMASIHNKADKKAEKNYYHQKNSEKMKKKKKAKVLHISKSLPLLDHRHREDSGKEAMTENPQYCKTKGQQYKTEFNYNAEFDPIFWTKKLSKSFKGILTRVGFCKKIEKTARLLNKLKASKFNYQE